MMDKQITGAQNMDRHMRHKHELILWMEAHDIDALLVPHRDEYFSEYIHPHFDRLWALTGFRGSAGYGVVTRKSYGGCHIQLFVDGRYSEQAKRTMDANHVHIGRLEAWMEELDACRDARNAEPHASVHGKWRVAACSSLHSLDEATRMQNRWECIWQDTHPLDEVWQDRPSPPSGKIYQFAHAAWDVDQKSALVAGWMQQASVDHLWIGAQDSIAWSLNVRGSDVDHNPFALSHLLASLVPDQNTGLHLPRVHWTWFVPQGVSRIEADVANALKPHIEILASTDIAQTLASLEGVVGYDPLTTSIAWQGMIKKAKPAAHDDPIARMRMIKQPVELACIKSGHIKDARAWIKWRCWLEESLKPSSTLEPSSVGASDNQHFDEQAAAQAMETFKKMENGYVQSSFATIAGSGPNGSIIHYRPPHSNSRMLSPDEPLLFDCGSQYVDATTDETRVVLINASSSGLLPPGTRNVIRSYNFVLASLARISGQIFPSGTTGQQLDALARSVLWQHARNYAHGTGHGVGFAAGVHEGPVGIHPRSIIPLASGMVLSLEPGDYEPGAYGVRLENLVEVINTSHAQGWLGFEPLTLIPFERSMIDPSLLGHEALAWLNAYHVKVWNALKDQIDIPSKSWLLAACAPIAHPA